MPATFCYIAVSIHLLLLLIFPGIFLNRFLASLNLLSKITAIFFFSLGFWICAAWYISWASIPLKTAVFSVLAGFIVFYLTVSYRDRKRRMPPGSAISIKKIPLYNVILIVALLFYTVPFLFISIPPGNDTAMHGYITRLIINNDGLPRSYRPILPVEYFGSYSAGYHVITALVAGLKVPFLRFAINLVTIAVYPLTLLALIFFFSCFFSSRTAIYCSLIVFTINNTIQGSIGWGGNPTVFAFAFSIFSAGVVLRAVRIRSTALFYLSAICIASIPLIHAIPAITFIYLCIPAFAMLLYHYSDQRKSLFKHMVVLVLFILLLLLPFILNFRNENSPELLTMIRNWQKEMMSNKFTHSFSGNLSSTAEQIKYRIGDPLTILAGISLTALIFFKKFREIIYIMLFAVCIYVLIFNYAYWFLPFSELLYPERVVYFMIVCITFFSGYFLYTLESMVAIQKLMTIPMKIYYSIVIILLAVGAFKAYSSFYITLQINPVHCDKQTIAGFDWITDHTEKDALIVATYQDAGMWVPAFCNRATLGTHLHFIHWVAHIPDSLSNSTAPRYYFVTQRDVRANTAIVKTVIGKVAAFSNDSVAIFH